MKKATVLKILIKDKDISIRKFSLSANVPYTTLRSILERGIGNASLDNALKICRALDITVEQLDDVAEERISLNELLYSTTRSSLEADMHIINDWTPEELAEIENFKKYVLSKRTSTNNDQ